MDDHVREYIARIMSLLRKGAARGTATSHPLDLPGAIFSILTSREFCYLGRTRTEPYRERTVAEIARNIQAGEPVRFYYDIGAGYHASIDPSRFGLVFGVGFSELCVLAQVASFCNRVAEIHAPGARFILVIDNVCGLMTNDIPLENTKAYCADLRALIAQTGTGDRVDVLVESETFSVSEYGIDPARLRRDIATINPSPEDVENVGRFLGRPCDETEAVERMARYRQAGEMTEDRLERVVCGVRMTQRATGATLGFRPFPGGDSRTQVGELGITCNAKGNLRPVLLTSRNVQRYRCTRLEYPDLLPSTIRYVTFAEAADPPTSHHEK